MTILEKVEVYGKYFMDLAEDWEVEAYWAMVDAQDTYDAELAAQAAEISCCEATE
jgi:molybdopterin/thiamine biosynthesis adenylyltransferase